MNFFKNVRLKEVYRDVKTNEILDKLVSDINDENLKFLTNFVKIANLSKEKDFNHSYEIKTNLLSSISFSLIGLYRFLLNNRFNFVMPGEFTTDYIENEFAKFRESFINTYSINIYFIEKFPE